VDFSVAICAHNASRTISAVLDAALLQNPVPNEVVVIDDGSTDSTAKIVSQFTNVRLITLPENVGIAVARNRAIEESKHDLIIFIDADAVVKPNCFEALLKHASNSDVAAISGRGEEFYRYDFSNRFRALHAPQSLSSEPIEDAPMFMGLCFAIRKGIAQKVGGFDPKFRTNGEDADMSFRIKKAGFKIYYEPTAVVEHLKFDGFFGIVFQRFRFGYWMMRALKKNRVPSGWFIKPATKNLVGNGINRLKRLKLKEAAMFFALYLAQISGMATGFFG